jgi:cation transport regulator ChaB
MPRDEQDLPAPLKRSPAKAQRTYLETLESAEEQYGEGERAHRTAYAALKHSLERVGGRWVPKEQRGPSDPQARKGGADARENPSEMFDGVDVEGNTKKELLERARELDVGGRSRMTKHELARAIARKQP